MANCDLCEKPDASRHFTAEMDIDGLIIRVQIYFDSWLTMRWLCVRCAKSMLASLAGYRLTSIVSSPLEAKDGGR